VGGGTHGLPHGLDRRWPAPRGVAQHPWEPSRTVAPRSQAHRKARVKALGNAVVPAVAYRVGMRLLHRLSTY
jgi:DNA (cytosine-5)-methyltransferase 1